MLGNGHNGYLDLALQVGVPGMVLVTFAAIVWPLLRLFSSRIASPARRALIVAVVIFCAGHNITETSLFDRDMIVHVFLMFAIALICIETTNRTVWVEGTRE
jgi:O-antigen ligase